MTANEFVLWLEGYVDSMLLHSMENPPNEWTVIKDKLSGISDEVLTIKQFKQWYRKQHARD